MKIFGNHKNLLHISDFIRTFARVKDKRSISNTKY